VSAVAHPERSGNPDSVLPETADVADRPLPPLDPGVDIGHVHLKAADLDRLEAFYRDVIGLEVVGRLDHASFLAADGYHHHVGINDWFSGGKPLTGHSRPGLYHTAFLYPSRAALGTALARVAAYGWPLDGASDHGVSEAIYLRDPEGNGIELYRDRPREEWTYESDGTLRMGVEPLDVESVLAARDPAVALDAPASLKVGHVHLQVSSTAQAEAFYRDIIGFDLIVRYGNQASFLSAGGYHHHLGANTWHTRGAPPADPGTPGLFHHAIRYPTLDALLDGVRRVVGSEYPLEGASDHGVSIAVYLRDPDGIGVELYWDRPREEWPREDGGAIAMRRDPVDLRAAIKGGQPPEIAAP
jgi:catechol 2,3-dioxygenase